MTEDRVVTDLGVAAGVSDRGLRHRRNEDAMALRQVADGSVIAAVADGVSLSDRPDRASRVAADTTVAGLARELSAGREPEAAVRAGIGEAASAVAGLHGSGEYPGAPASTVVAAAICGGHITVGWIGDSRAYWLATGTGPGPRCLTTDDTWAGQAVRAGTESPQQAYREGRAGPLWRWLGADADREPAQVVTFEATGTGTVLLCSDGLWNYVWSSRELTAVVRTAGTPLAAATVLADVAVRAGGRDNITAVVVTVPPAAG